MVVVAWISIEACSIGSTPYNAIAIARVVVGRPLVTPTCWGRVMLVKRRHHIPIDSALWSLSILTVVVVIIPPRLFATAAAAAAAASRPPAPPLLSSMQSFHALVALEAILTVSSSPVPTVHVWVHAAHSACRGVFVTAPEAASRRAVPEGGLVAALVVQAFGPIAVARRPIIPCGMPISTRRLPSLGRITRVRRATVAPTSTRCPRRLSSIVRHWYAPPRESIAPVSRAITQPSIVVEALAVTRGGRTLIRIMGSSEGAASIPARTTATWGRRWRLRPATGVLRWWWRVVAAVPTAVASKERVLLSKRSAVWWVAATTPTRRTGPFRRHLRRTATRSVKTATAAAAAAVSAHHAVALFIPPAAAAATA
jgi:hypothetical protein